MENPTNSKAALTSCYREGYNAALEGKPETADPYKPLHKKGTGERSYYWQLGHYQGTKDRPALEARIATLGKQLDAIILDRQLVALEAEIMGDAGLELPPEVNGTATNAA